MSEKQKQNKNKEQIQGDLRFEFKMIGSST